MTSQATTTVALPAATVTRDQRPNGPKLSAYEVECGGLFFHVQRFGREWIIDGRDRDGLPEANFDDAVARLNGRSLYHRSLRAAVLTIREANSAA